MRLSVFVVASVLAAGMLPTVSFAQTADPAQTANTAQTGDTAQTANTDLDQVVCRKTAPPVGTRLGGGRVCHTQREWDQMRKDAQMYVQQQQLLARAPSGN
jgi:hypothetical protein